jgi:hypothetical protein
MELPPISPQKIILTLLAVFHEYPRMHSCSFAGKPKKTPGAESNCREYIYGADEGTDKTNLNIFR